MRDCRERKDLCGLNHCDCLILQNCVVKKDKEQIPSVRTAIPLNWPASQRDGCHHYTAWREACLKRIL